MNDPDPTKDSWQPISKLTDALAETPVDPTWAAELAADREADRETSLKDDLLDSEQGT